MMCIGSGLVYFFLCGIQFFCYCLYYLFCFGEVVVDIIEFLVFSVKNNVLDLYLLVGLLLIICVDGEMCKLNVLVFDYK